MTVRIKAVETDIDKTWNLNMDEIQEGGKFVSVFAKDGSQNGYYELNGNSAKSLFNTTAGGSVSGLFKVKIN